MPNARITGIDFAAGMLTELRRKFRDRDSQIELIEGSYVGMSLGEHRYDYVIATLTVHHIAQEAKVALYCSVRKALKPGGKYVQGDQSTSKQREEEILRWYDSYISTLPGGESAEWNYDVTLSPETEERLLRKAGFTTVTQSWAQWKDSENGLAVFVASNST